MTLIFGNGVGKHWASPDGYSAGVQCCKRRSGPMHSIASQNIWLINPNRKYFRAVKRIAATSKIFLCSTDVDSYKLLFLHQQHCCWENNFQWLANRVLAS